jgi:ABC-3C protein
LLWYQARVGGLPFSAAGSTDSTLFQVRYSLLLLVRAALTDPTVTMRVEGLDDIEILKRSGLELIQAKQHQVVTNLTDRSADLWKTLRVWSYAVKVDPSLLAGTLFTLVTTSKCLAGSAIQTLAEHPGFLPTARQVEKVFSSIAKLASSKANAAAYAEYLGLSVADRQSLLLQVRVLDGSPNNLDVEEELSNALRTSVTGAPQLRVLLRRLEGWWQTRVAHHLRDRQDQITGGELLLQVREIADSLGPDTLPVNEELLKFDPSLEIKSDTSTYVRQLRLVGCGSNVTLGAIRDFTRSQRQIAEWMREELMFVGELGRYKDRLVEAWRLRFDLLLDQCKEAKETEGLVRRGLNLYTEIILQNLPIRRDFVEGFIMRGTYHSLADTRSVGWHPRYEELL